MRRSDPQLSQLNVASLGPRIADGRTAEVFEIDEERVLKLLRPGFPPRIAAHEAAVADIVSAVYPGAPRYLGMAQVGRRTGITFERVDGRTMDSIVREHPWRLRRLAQRLGELHATIHGADGSGLIDQRQALLAAIGEAPSDLPVAVRDAAVGRIEGLPTGSSLCHGDLHPGNVILGPTRVVIIDWGNAQAGNPIADVARSLYLMRDTPMHEPRIMRPIVAAIRARFAAEYLARYRQLRPLDAVELQAWRFPILVARLAENIEDERDGLRSAIAREVAALPAPGLQPRG